MSPTVEVSTPRTGRADVDHAEAGHALAGRSGGQARHPRRSSRSQRSCSMSSRSRRTRAPAGVATRRGPGRAPAGQRPHLGPQACPERLLQVVGPTCMAGSGPDLDPPGEQDGEVGWTVGAIAQTSQPFSPASDVQDQQRGRRVEHVPQARAPSSAVSTSPMGPGRCPPRPAPPGRRRPPGCGRRKAAPCRHRNSTVTSDPRPGSLASRILPPLASSSSRDKARPSPPRGPRGPRPGRGRRTEGCSRFSLMPTPVSLNTTKASRPEAGPMRRPLGRACGARCRGGSARSAARPRGRRPPPAPGSRR